MGIVMVGAVVVEEDVLSKFHTPEEAEVTLIMLSLQPSEAAIRV